MQVTVTIPDDLAARVLTQGRDAADAALESLGIEAYRAGRLSQYELQQLLGLENRFDVEKLLKDHKVQEGAYSLQDFLDDQAALAELQPPRSIDAA